MGISKGHTFTDGETVTAAKLNNLVDNATITSDTISEAMIKNGAVTSDKLGTNAVTGASIAANTINVSSLSNATGGGPGTLVQSGAGGVFEEFTPGTSGTFLKSAGTDAALEWGRVDSDGVADTMISGHTVLSSPGADDEVLVKEKSGINKRSEIQNLFKVVSGLTAMPSTDVVSTDEFLIIDGGFPRKITKANLESALGGGQLPLSGSNYYTSTGDTLYDILDDSSNLATFAHGLSSTPRLIRMVLVCITDDTSGFGFSVGDEIDMANVYYWDGDNYQVAAATVTADSTNIKAQFQISITNNGLALVMMQKTTVSPRSAGAFYYFSDVAGSTNRFKLKVYAWE